MQQCDYKAETETETNPEVSWKAGREAGT